MDNSTPPIAEAKPVVRPLDPAEDIAKNKDLAALSYFWILSLVVYWTKKDSPFIRFHARQGITLFVLSLLAATAPVISKLLELLILVGCAFGFMNAAQGKMANLPLIAAISRFDWRQLRTDWQNIVDAAGKFWRSVMNHVPKSAPHAAPTPTPANPAPSTPSEPIIVPPAPPAPPSSSTPA